MTFISTISERDASADVKLMYDKNLDAMGYIPNYARVFSHRPEVMEAWGNLLSSIRSNMDARRYELITIAAARALKSSYCMLAHGSILQQDIFSPEQLTSIAQDYQNTELTSAEKAMMAFAEQVVHDATSITQQDVDELRQNGFSDPEIFDITTVATARCFFSKTLDALGAEPDEVYLDLENGLRESLIVGRPISGQGSGQQDFDFTE